LAQWSHQLNEVNEQLTDDDLLSFVENQETALQDNSTCVGELDAYLAHCNVNNYCMQFWQENVNKFSKLPADLKHFIPSTSAAMERRFSAAISEMLSDPG